MSKQQVIMWIINRLSRYLVAGEPKVHYIQQGFCANYVDRVEYPLSYILTCHDNNRNRSFLTGKDSKLHVEIDTSK